MKQTILTAILPATLFTFGACNDGNDVNEELAELQEARQETGEQVAALEEDLQAAKQRVIDLEKELALARQGITDDVLEERKDLKEALAEAEDDVDAELTQARKQADELDQSAERAARSLEATHPPEVSADIATDTEVQQQQVDVQATTEREEIAVERPRIQTTDDTELEETDEIPRSAKPVER